MLVFISAMGKLLVTVFAPPGAGFRLRRLADPQLLLLHSRQIRNGSCTRTPAFAMLRRAETAKSAPSAGWRNTTSPYCHPLRVMLQNRSKIDTFAY